MIVLGWGSSDKKKRKDFFFFLVMFKQIPDLWLSEKTEKLGYSFQEMILETIEFIFLYTKLSLSFGKKI